MILDLTKGFVPEVYSDSRDYRVFLRLASVLLSVLRDNIGSIPSLYSADDCPESMLRLLAGMVGYKYDSLRTVESNRMIIKYFPLLLRNRGSKLGIKIAAALSLNSLNEVPQYSLDNIIVEYDYEKGLIKIYYPQTDALCQDLIEVVRPVGVRVEMIPSFISKNVDELRVLTDLESEVEAWNESRTNVEVSKVGFGDTGSDRYKKGEKLDE